MATTILRLRTMVVILIAYSPSLPFVKGAARSHRCLSAPTVEDCSIVRLKWSFIAGTNKCEHDFVCADHLNSFESERECNSTCPPVPTLKPKPKVYNCEYYLTHLYLCRKTSLSQHYDKRRILHIILWFTHCKGSESKVYSYDIYTHKCKDWSKYSPKIPK
uniref:BPTI/Kunitz inhibitor domain-containing protein n=1 Tax=Amblyomma maculatum TaxID=34609 RepID=G3MSB4_AMBMU